MRKIPIKLHGGNGNDIEPIPRHGEINELLAKAIIKRRKLK